PRLAPERRVRPLAPRPVSGAAQAAQRLRAAPLCAAGDRRAPAQYGPLQLPLPEMGVSRLPDVAAGWRDRSAAPPRGGVVQGSACGRVVAGIPGVLRALLPAAGRVAPGNQSGVPAL